METEYVDAAEFAAIELAMAQAGAGCASSMPQPPAPRPQSANANFSQNSSAQVGPPPTTFNPAPCSGPTNAQFSTSAGASQRTAGPQHNQPQAPNNRNNAQRMNGTLDCFVVNSSNSNGAHGVAPSHNGMGQGQNNRSPCKPLSQANQQQPAGSATAWSGNAVVVTFKVLEGGKRFSAQCGYNVKIIETFKTCKDRIYDQPTKTWNFGIPSHQELLTKLQALEGVNVKPLPPYTLKAVQDGAKDEERIEKSVDVKAEMARLPADLLEALMPFQREGVEFAIRHEGRCLIGDEMGLGKTIQAIAIAKIYERDWPLLIVCPSSLRMVWRGELLRWVSDLEEADVVVVMTGKDKIGEKVTIISYDLLVKLEKEVRERRFKVVVCDESHFLKNPKAKRTAITAPIIEKSRRAVLLTGTPALSKPSELYQQVTALKKGLLPPWDKFATHFCAGVMGRWGLEANGASNLDELRMILQRVMIRRLKQDVLTQLPAKRRQQIYVSLEKKKQKDFQRRMDQMKTLGQKEKSFNLGQEERDAAKAENRQMLNQLYQDTGVAKLAAVDEYVSDMIHTGYKFLVFAHHLEVLDGIEATVKNNKTRYIRIDGATPQGQRSNLVDVFQNDPDVLVAVLSMTAAGQGLTLTAASAVVFAELHWTPGVMVQAEDRAHRIGQQYSVNVHFLLAKGSADDIMWPVIEKKINVVGNTLDGQSNNLSGDTRTIDDPTDGGAQTQLDAFFSQAEQPEQQQRPSAAKDTAPCGAGEEGFSDDFDEMVAGPSHSSGAGRSRPREEEGGMVDDDDDDFEDPTAKRGGRGSGGKGGGGRTAFVPLVPKSDAQRATTASQRGEGAGEGQSGGCGGVEARGPSGGGGGGSAPRIWSRSEVVGRDEGGGKEPAPKKRRRVIEVGSDDDD